VLVKAVATPSQSVFANYFLFYFLVIPRLLRMAHQTRPRMLYSRFLATELCLALTARWAGWRYVVEYNGAIGEELRLKQRPALVVRVVDLLERACLGLANHVIAVTAGLKDYLVQRQGLDPAKIMVVPNGVNPDLCRPLNPADCRRELRLDPDEPYLLFVGSLQAWHGAERLVGVLEILAAQGRRVSLIVVGSGPGEDTLRRRVTASRVGQRIILTGKVDYRLVPRYIGAATVCLAPYPDTIVGRHGLAPLKIREFMACGRPLVTTAVGGLDALMREAGAGLVAQSNSEEDLARAVTQLLDDPDLRERLGRAGRAYATAHLSWQAKAREILRGVSREED
jgi:glycosyltransferase involved in cell wall biosynthesis